MQQSLVELLRKEFERLKERNPSYSLRAYAKKLRVTPSSLSEIMSGKRMPTLRFGKAVMAGLRVEASERDQLLKTLFLKNTRARAEFAQKESLFTVLKSDEYALIEHWFYFAVLSLAETRSFRGDAKWIARRLGIRVEEAAKALDLLLRMNLLKSTGRSIRPTGRGLATTSGIPNSIIRRAHLQNLSLIEKSLQETPLELQDFSAITMATSAAKLEEAKKKIRVFRRELMQFMEAGPKEEVYNLSLFLFPITKPNQGVTI